jgi:hypothetical protein
MLYKSTMLDRGSLITDAIEGKWEHNKIPYHIDLIARAHIHQFFLNQNESRISYINPCWKFWHPIRKFGAKSYPFSQPTIGGTVIEIGDTICVKKFTYPTVQIYDALIQERAA